MRNAVNDKRLPFDALRAIEDLGVDNDSAQRRTADEACDGRASPTQFTQRSVGQALRRRRFTGPFGQAVIPPSLETSFEDLADNGGLRLVRAGDAIDHDRSVWRMTGAVFALRSAARVTGAGLVRARFVFQRSGEDAQHRLKDVRCPVEDVV